MPDHLTTTSPTTDHPRRHRPWAAGPPALLAVAMLLGACGGDDAGPPAAAGAADDGGTSTAAAAEGTTEDGGAAAQDAAPEEDATTTTVPSEAGDDDPCRLLTAAEAEAALGRPVAEPVVQRISDLDYGPLFDCAYGSPDESAGPSSVHVGQLGEGIPRDDWEAAQRADGAQEVDGVGDIAFFDGDGKLDAFADGRWIQAQVVNTTRFEELLAVLSEVVSRALTRL